MANRFNWRGGDTHPVVLPVNSATVIEIGDLVYLATDNVRPASDQSDEGVKSANQQLFHDLFAGVALEASANGETTPVRVATAGVFEFACLSTAFEVGFFVGVDENDAGNALLNDRTGKVANANAAIGRCASRVNPAGTSLLVAIDSSLLTGGTQAVL